MDLPQDVFVVGGLDVHESEEDGRRGERLVEKLKVTGVHDNFDQRFARGVFEFTLAQVNGHDLLSLNLADDALSTTADIQNQSLGGEVGNGNLKYRKVRAGQIRDCGKTGDECGRKN